jgi:hypothetical protein
LSSSSFFLHGGAGRHRLLENSGAEKPEERFGEMAYYRGLGLPAGYHQARGTSVTIDKKPLQPR